MKQKTLLFILFLLSTLMASAYDAKVDGVYYTLITKGKAAEVTSGDTKYTGNVTIPESFTYNGVTYSVTSIGEKAFSLCSGLTSITISNSVTNIGNLAFQGCSGLTSITIPNSVTSIGNYAFNGCSGLKKVIVKDITAWLRIEFGTGANPLIYAQHLYSDEDTEITNLIIPNSVTSIGSWALSYCSGLTSVTIHNSVTSIGDYAFWNCSGLTSVIIPNSVKNIGKSAFYSCPGLTSITIGNSVTSIGESAFNECTGLTSITIPNSVKSIGNYAFQSCSGLTSVTIGNSVTSIGYYAFEYCSGLTSVTIPNSVTSIGKQAFNGCSGLTSITIPNSVTSIGSNAFSGCSELADVYCYAKYVPSTSSDAFKDSYVNYATLYVPEGSVAAYKAKEPWSGFGTITPMSGEIPIVEKCATPTISYENGKLKFSCDTEGATFQYSITDTDIKAGSGNEVQLTTTYKVTVYATKDGYENSDVATKDINVGGGASGLRGDVNNDGTVSMPDAMFIVNKILNGKFPDE